ncbi:MAG: monovalent cation/H(+) antiporter subunit G [Gammaproteobacteria bacterium]
MIESIAEILLLVGCGFVLIGAIGVVRMPDLMLRMHTTTKAGALGGGLIAIAAGVYFAEAEVMVRAIAILAFVLLTSPIAAHAIGRAGYFVGVPFWDKTLKDELRDKLDTQNHWLHSGMEADAPEQLQAQKERSEK